MENSFLTYFKNFRIFASYQMDKFKLGSLCSRGGCDREIFLSGKGTCYPTATTLSTVSRKIMNGVQTAWPLSARLETFLRPAFSWRKTPNDCTSGASHKQLFGLFAAALNGFSRVLLWKTMKHSFYRLYNDIVP